MYLVERQLGHCEQDVKVKIMLELLDFKVSVVYRSNLIFCLLPTVWMSLNRLHCTQTFVLPRPLMLNRNISKQK